MTNEGRLARGKENAERGRFLNNQETIDYLATVEANTVEVEEAEDAEPAE